MSGTPLNPRDIIQVTIQFPNQPAKMRPALVISNNFVNQNSDRVIVLPMTANPNRDPYMVPIQTSDIESGSLPLQSQVIIDNVFTISKDVYVKTYGRVNTAFYKNVINELTSKVIEP